MAKRTVELDEDRQETEGQRALHEAEERAERAEAELARLRRAQGLHDAVTGETHGHATAHPARKDEETKRTEPRGHETAEHETRAPRKEPEAEREHEAEPVKAGHRHRGHAEELEGDLFAGQKDADEAGAEQRSTRSGKKDDADDETPARHAQRKVAETIEEDRHGGRGARAAHEEDETGRGERATARHGRMDPENDPGNAGEVKEPPTRSSAEGEPEMEGGEDELRKDSMMAHLLDSLEAGKDIGHYGRLVFAMVSRHFLPHEEVLAWMAKDRDFGEEEAELMLRQVEGRDYSPPRRAKILEYQREQDFPILPHPHDPDCGNLYRNLKFPDAVYKHIGHYQEQKMEADDE